MLESSPSYFYYVPNPSLKLNVQLFAWSRPTIEWSINCEWNGQTRAYANSYYRQTFTDPSGSFQAIYCADIFMWMAALILAISGFQMIMALIDPKKVEEHFGKALMACYFSRIAWIVTISILFHRVNGLWDVGQ